MERAIETPPLLQVIATVSGLPVYEPQCSRDELIRFLEECDRANGIHSKTFEESHSLFSINPSLRLYDAVMRPEEWQPPYVNTLLTGNPIRRMGDDSCPFVSNDERFTPAEMFRALIAEIVRSIDGFVSDDCVVSVKLSHNQALENPAYAAGDFELSFKKQNGESMDDLHKRIFRKIISVLKGEETFSIEDPKFEASFFVFVDGRVTSGFRRLKALLYQYREERLQAIKEWVKGDCAEVVDDNGFDSAVEGFVKEVAGDPAVLNEMLRVLNEVLNGADQTDVSPVILAVAEVVVNDSSKQGDFILTVLRKMSGNDVSNAVHS
ncbi:hypothetical protein A2291_04630 [candidate division WOR-1 bacterium RIFOXYB2_FULL_42_35]|uniref:Uncharacterized protein n=1 Tax=candidate division WOR-1 bacterium RIFOXYC2_FULL_41_25 TaxID=1802586 RepID=A0A1F4TLD9_UNCSA|nr:MAG: hypothetical protein A2291_04630 [candidate division WOR-1 bacterium RIFOXYB2_FULL_42_35]OGC33528.1 MAG: hypothetical protein A2462_06955 [candidate division WOR-1 bacterium RIFOXYC2_FULL_41_25]